LNQLVENLKYLYDIVINLIPAAGTNVTPLPTASGDGIIRYVVSVNRDMIWTSTTPPPASEREDEGRYFVAVYEEYEYSKYRYHLEIWKWEGTG